MKKLFALVLTLILALSFSAIAEEKKQMAIVGNI